MSNLPGKMSTAPQPCRRPCQRPCQRPTTRQFGQPKALVCRTGCRGVRPVSRDSNWSALHGGRCASGVGSRLGRWGCCRGDRRSGRCSRDGGHPIGAEGLADRRESLRCAGSSDWRDPPGTRSRSRRCGGPSQGRDRRHPRWSLARSTRMTCCRRGRVLRTSAGQKRRCQRYQGPSRCWYESFPRVGGRPAGL